MQLGLNFFSFFFSGTTWQELNECIESQNQQIEKQNKEIAEMKQRLQQHQEELVKQVNQKPDESASLKKIQQSNSSQIMMDNKITLKNNSNNIENYLRENDLNDTIKLSLEQGHFTNDQSKDGSHISSQPQISKQTYFSQQTNNSVSVYAPTANANPKKIEDQR